MPDSGADISVAGRALLSHLHKHPDNLLPSTVTPRAVKAYRQAPSDNHTWDCSVRRGFSHLPRCFHHSSVMESCKGSENTTRMLPLPVELPASPLVATIQPPPGIGIMEEFPSVFDGTVKVIEGDITLADDASTPPGQSHLLSVIS